MIECNASIRLLKQSIAEIEKEEDAIMIEVMEKYESKNKIENLIREDIEKFTPLK